MKREIVMRRTLVDVEDRLCEFTIIGKADNTGKMGKQFQAFSYGSTDGEPYGRGCLLGWFATEKTAIQAFKDRCIQQYRLLPKGQEKRHKKTYKFKVTQEVEIEVAGKFPKKELRQLAKDICNGANDLDANWNLNNIPFFDITAIKIESLGVAEE